MSSGDFAHQIGSTAAKKLSLPQTQKKLIQACVDQAASLAQKLFQSGEDHLILNSEKEKKKNVVKGLKPILKKLKPAEDIYTITTCADQFKNSVSIGMFFSLNSKQLRLVQAQNLANMTKFNLYEEGELELFGVLVALHLLKIDSQLGYTNGPIRVRTDGFEGIQGIIQGGKTIVQKVVRKMMSELPEGGWLEFIGAAEMGNNAYDVCYKLAKIKPPSDGREWLYQSEHDEKVFIEHVSYKADLVARTSPKTKKKRGIIQSKDESTKQIKRSKIKVFDRVKDNRTKNTSKNIEDDFVTWCLFKAHSFAHHLLKKGEECLVLNPGKENKENDIKGLRPILEKLKPAEDIYTITTYAETDPSKSLISVGMFFSFNSKHLRLLQTRNLYKTSRFNFSEKGELQLFGVLVALRLLGKDSKLEYTGGPIRVQMDGFKGIQGVMKGGETIVQKAVMKMMSAFPEGGWLEFIGAKDSGSNAYDVCYKLAKIRPSSDEREWLYHSEHDEKVFIKPDSSKADLVAKNILATTQERKDLSRAVSQKMVPILKAVKPPKSEAKITQSNEAGKGLFVLKVLKEAGMAVVNFLCCCFPQRTRTTEETSRLCLEKESKIEPSRQRNLKDDVQQCLDRAQSLAIQLYKSGEEHLMSNSQKEEKRSFIKELKPIVKKLKSAEDIYTINTHADLSETSVSFGMIFSFRTNHLRLLHSERSKICYEEELQLFGVLVALNLLRIDSELGYTVGPIRIHTDGFKGTQGIEEGERTIVQRALRRMNLEFSETGWLEFGGAKEMGNNAHDVCYELANITPPFNGLRRLCDREHNQKAFTTPNLYKIEASTMAFEECEHGDKLLGTLCQATRKKNFQRHPEPISYQIQMTPYFRDRTLKLLKIAKSIATGMLESQRVFCVYDELRKNRKRDQRSLKYLQSCADEIPPRLQQDPDSKEENSYWITTDMSMKAGLITYGMVFSYEANYIRGVQLDMRTIPINLGDLEFFGVLISLMLLPMDPKLVYRGQMIHNFTDSLDGIRGIMRGGINPNEVAVMTTLAQFPKGGRITYNSTSEMHQLCHDIAGHLSGAIGQHDGKEFNCSAFVPPIDKENLENCWWKERT
ncbi:hypothetical protein L596_009244 [Steinernema carpocapsae]|uniref:Uncharacterized protein n=1 Tax=Steinernema carpocapsae TaxID=34508 RepID=A0A4U5PFK8_STECR|nr:hypothetical protein L596_009244 [Steinernema carpocapsae]